MFMRKRLACLFCGKGAAEVSKLVAGPRVVICDACVAEDSRLVSDPTNVGAAQPQAAPNLWRKLRSWFRRHGISRAEAEAQPLPPVVRSAVQL